MKKTTTNIKSLPQLLDTFKTDDDCKKYYEWLRWKGDPNCPHCKSYKIYRTNRGFKCGDSRCYRKFTVLTGTVFANSKIPLRTWFAVIFLATVHKKGISSLQLATDLGLTQKTAWYCLHRVREMLKNHKPEIIGGGGHTVEGDETFIGGREANRHKKKKQSRYDPNLNNSGRPYAHKKIVLGIKQRKGKVVLSCVDDIKAETLVPIIDKYVATDTRICTDEHSGYSRLKHKYEHLTVVHSAKVYVQGESHTNGIENVWSGLKRMIYGTYHQISAKHIESYLNEFAARFNARENNPYLNFEDFLTRSEGNILYKVLTATEEKKRTMFNVTLYPPDPHFKGSWFDNRY